MKTKFARLIVTLIGTIAWLTTAAQSVNGIPDGNYLLTVEIRGKEQRLNLKIQDGKAKCVKASDPSLANVEGYFQKGQLQGAPPNAVLARFRNGIDSQLWILRADGAIAVREIPDRGEQQSAVPVNGDSLEAPKKK
jgi:hypothetical protein